MSGSTDGPIVLFICSGNIYRSRYAEAYFNHRAEAAGIAAHAISRGLTVEVVEEDISPLTEQAMRDRGIARSLTAPGRQALSRGDLERADLVVALREDEHRPMIRAQYPEWEDLLRYWDVADRGDWPVEKTITAIERNVDRLLDEMTTRPSGPDRPASRGPTKRGPEAL